MHGHKQEMPAFAGDRQQTVEVGSLRKSLRFMVIVSSIATVGCSGVSGDTPSTLLVPLSEGVLAGELGKPLDKKARLMAAEAEYRALETGPTGLPVKWQLSETLYGNVVPQQPYTVGTANCRRYVHTVNADGDVRSAAGTACRGEDGIWQPLS